MEHVKVLKIINELEKRFPMDEWKAGEHHVWPLVRIKLAFLLYLDGTPKADSPMAPVDPGKPFSISKKIKTIVNWQNRSIKHRIDNYFVEKKIKRPGTIAFFSLVANRTLLENVWHNRSVDPIVDDLKNWGLPLALFEYKGYGAFKFPRYNNEICINFDQVFNSNITNKTIPGDAISLPRYDEFLTSVKAEFPQLETKTISREVTVKTMDYFDAAVAYFYKLLKNSGIQICFTTCYYEMKMMALIAACKKANIRSVELPHGTHGDTHAGYGKWMKVPQQGYAALPDVFWCWSRYEKAAIDEWSVPQRTPHKAVVGGNPWLQAWKDDNHPMVKKFDAKINTLKKEGQLQILYTVQPFGTFDEALPPYVIEAIRRSPANWQWLVRLHPRQAQPLSQFEKVLKQEAPNANCNIKEATELPLPALLRHADVHFTAFSSTVVEAAAFNVPSVVFENGNAIFKTLVVPELLHCSDTNAKSIIEGIQIQLNNPYEQAAEEIDFKAVLKKLLGNSQG